MQRRRGRIKRLSNIIITGGHSVSWFLGIIWDGKHFLVEQYFFGNTLINVSLLILPILRHQPEQAHYRYCLVNHLRTKYNGNNISFRIIAVLSLRTFSSFSTFFNFNKETKLSCQLVLVYSLSDIVRAIVSRSGTCDLP